MNYNSRLTAITHTLTGHELQYEINRNHSHTHGTWTTIRDKQQSLTHHGTWTTIRDKQQSLTHSRDMNYNSRLTAITHTLTGHELKYEINSNHSHTQGHELQFEINSNHSHTHGTWTTIRDKQQSLTHSRDMNYNSRLTAITHTLTGHELQFEINSNHSHTHGTWTTIRDKQHSLTITGHELQFEINSNHSHTHGTWTTIRDKKQSLTHSRDMNYNTR